MYYHLHGEANFIYNSLNLFWRSIVLTILSNTCACIVSGILVLSPQPDFKFFKSHVLSCTLLCILQESTKAWNDWSLGWLGRKRTVKCLLFMSIVLQCLCFTYIVLIHTIYTIHKRILRLSSFLWSWICIKEDEGYERGSWSQTAWL